MATVANPTDHELMGLALDEARLALNHDDVPIGAVLVRDGVVLAGAHNRREVDHDPTAHAEMLVLRAAAAKTGDSHLDGTTLCSGPTTRKPGRLVRSTTSVLILASHMRFRCEVVCGEKKQQNSSPYSSPPSARGTQASGHCDFSGLRAILQVAKAKPSEMAAKTRCIRRKLSPWV